MKIIFTKNELKQVLLDELSGFSSNDIETDDIEIDSNNYSDDFLTVEIKEDKDNG